MKVIIPAMIGPILTIAGLIANSKRKKIDDWMKARRIDNKILKFNTCEYCGKEMKNKETLTGPRKGMKATICADYPRCRNIRWG